MVQIFGIFALWLVVIALEPWIEAPKWAWYLSMAVLGIAWELLADDASRWWLGIGIAGAATVLSLVTDLVLVVTDWVRMPVLRRTR